MHQRRRLVAACMACAPALCASSAAMLMFCISSAILCVSSVIWAPVICTAEAGKGRSGGGTAREDGAGGGSALGGTRALFRGAQAPHPPWSKGATSTLQVRIWFRTRPPAPV